MTSLPVTLDNIISKSATCLLVHYSFAVCLITGHGHSNVGSMLAGGAAAAAAAYGAHHLSHGSSQGHGAHNLAHGTPYGHGYGHGKMKHGKFKHGKVGKHGGKFGKFKKWKW